MKSSVLVIADHLAPVGSVWDWIRAIDVLLGGVVIGMTAEILRRYWRLYHRPPRSARVGHVLAVASSYLVIVALLTYANAKLIGQHSSVERVTAPAGFVGLSLGIVGLYAMLRNLSGKSDRDDS